MLCASSVTESRGIFRYTAKLRGEVLFSVSQDGVQGDLLPYEAFLLVEGLKGPLSTQFTLLQLQTVILRFPPLLKT